MSFVHLGKLVAEAIHSLYIDIGSRLGELFTEILHLCIHKTEVVGHINVVAPHSLGKQCLIDNLVGVTQDLEQNIELLLE